MTRLDDWCIASTTPSPPYVIPFFKVQRYRNLQDCNGSQDNYDDTTFLGDDPNFCMRVGIEDGINYIYGSRRFYCDNNNDSGAILRSLKYTDRQCQDEATKSPSTFDGATASCPTGGGVAANTDSVYTADCVNVQYHCKDLTDTDFGVRVESPPLDRVELDDTDIDNKDETTSRAAMKHRNGSMAGLFCLVFSVLRWIKD